LGSVEAVDSGLVEAAEMAPLRSER
jgi:hypothetical protein